MVAVRSATNQVVAAATMDVAGVVVFVLVGRASHNEGLIGTLGTLWPFLAGLAAGWIVLRAWRSPRRVVWTGIGVWLATVIGGMLLRVASGQGVAISFVAVATLALAVLLLGWRLVASLIARSSARRTP
jgi:hypothetical protein